MLHLEAKPDNSETRDHGSVIVGGRSKWRRFLAFVGPGYLVSVGYMDPGNWSTDMAAGSRYGYLLLWVVLASSLMAMLLQTLCARLGIATGMDLARACRENCTPAASAVLWLLCEVAIIACDLAEVIGSAVALNLLFHIPLEWGVVITGFDVLLLLALQQLGMRKLEALVITLVATIFACFALNIWMARPDWPAAAHGLLIPQIPKGEGLLLAVGILGATVMPHNLYLHSSIVQSRGYERTTEGKKEAVRFATYDGLLALGAAFFVNAAILVLAAAVFWPKGQVVSELQDAHSLLKPALGGLAAGLFAVALLCAGQSSTITGTMAGQVVMEGFLKLRVRPWVRRLVTRLIAIVPAICFVIAQHGRNTMEILNWSQVILSMQLPFAIFPLVIFTSDRRKMGPHASPLWLKVVAYAIGGGITLVNLALIRDQYGDLVLGVILGIIGVGAGILVWDARRRRQALA